MNVMLQRAGNIRRHVLDIAESDSSWSEARVSPSHIGGSAYFQNSTHVRQNTSLSSSPQTPSVLRISQFEPISSSVNTLDAKVPAYDILSLRREVVDAEKRLGKDIYMLADEVNNLKAFYEAQEKAHERSTATSSPQTYTNAWKTVGSSLDDNVAKGGRVDRTLELKKVFRAFDFNESGFVESPELQVSKLT